MHMRMNFVIVFLVPFGLIFFPTNGPHSKAMPQVKYPIQEDHIQKSAAGADFKYESRVGETADKKYKLESSIKNNGTLPLSVKWKEAGIACTGFLQLPPGQTDSGTSLGIVEVPALINSTIEYGNSLQYSAPARMYIDPQPKEKDKSKSTSAEYKRFDANGSLVFSVGVVSTLDEASGNSVLTFTVTGNLSLAISGGVGAAASYTKGGDRWSVAPENSVPFGYRPETSDNAKAWLKEPIGADWPKGESRFLIFNNRETTKNQLKITLTGAAWNAQPVGLIGFVPGKDGFVGLTANIFLPLKAR